MLFIDPEKVKYVKWTGDPISYDLALKTLGGKAQEFVVHNPNIPQDLIKSLSKVPQTKRCVVWYYNNQWIAKRFTKGWRPEFGYYDVQVPRSSLKFNFLWTKNKDLGDINFDSNPYRNYQPTLDESFYELVWYLDPKFNPTEDKIWAVRCKNQENPCLGIKDMGYISPSYQILYNDDIPRMSYDIDFKIPWWELGYTYRWMLDKKHCENSSVGIWAFQISFSDDPAIIKIVGEVSPEYVIEYNPELPELDYDIEYVTPYHDFQYEHVWMLDNKHCETAPEPIWAVKVKYIDHTEGSKIIGEISPNLDITYNPDLPKVNYSLDYVIPYHDLGYEHVWMLDNKHCDFVTEEMWAVKITAAREIEGSKVMGEISPQHIVVYNPDLPKLKYEIDYTIQHFDFDYEHVWMLDSKHCENAPEEIWAVKVRVAERIKGSKIVGEVAPRLKVSYNPTLPKLNYNIDYNIHYHDLAYEHVWMLHKKHCELAPEEIWAVKVSAVDQFEGSKIIDEVSPVLDYKFNKELKGFKFEEPDINIPYYDFEYEHIWNLDKNYSDNHDIWAIKAKYVNKTKGEKVIDFAQPIQTFTYNPDIKNNRIAIDYKIPFYDRFYNHVWYVDTSLTNGEKIWFAKSSASDKIKGEKDMGFITPNIEDQLDVIFISYNEPNKEKNWKRVLEKAPWAKRVDGVKGIFSAHQAAAKLSGTDMFYVVDGDAWLVDDWKFDYRPSIFDRDCTYVWYSVNPINGLEYGYGGVKLFPKKQLLKTKKWTTMDMTTGLSSKLKVLTQIANLSTFNTDEFSTWKSSFRECVKLKINLLNNPDDKDTAKRLSAWKTKGKSKPFGKVAISAAEHAEMFVEENKNNPDILLKINDMDWLKNKYNTLLKQKNHR